MTIRRAMHKLSTEYRATYKIETIQSHDLHLHYQIWKSAFIQQLQQSLIILQIMNISNLSSRSVGFT